MRTVAVVLAGGSGLRLGGTAPKQLQTLAGRTLLEHSVAAFQLAQGVDEIVVVMAPSFLAQARRTLGDRYGKVSDIIAGGADRPGSTRRAIEWLSRAGRGVTTSAGAQDGDGPDCNVLFHDAARPLVDQRIIADCVAGLRSCQALGVVVPTADTIVEVTGGVMTKMPPRETLGRCQTPQGFRLSVIRRAHQLAEADPRAAEFSATDDCGIVLRYLPEIEVRAVPGSERNLKITYTDDLRVAEMLLRSND
ncbi:MAG TPA: IspD/TarI family cytidylyltransferase [Streptosporangiaceae bacterium]|nr:IspD/TarI family cytidylyltransferase [Streptosporangiaceae bacterium]